MQTGAELRKVKIYRGLSEETTAFTARLWWFRNHIGYVKNNGRGGANQIDPLYDSEGVSNRGVVQQFEEWCTQQKRPTPSMPKTGSPAELASAEVDIMGWSEPLPMTPDYYISLLLDDYELTQTLKRWCRKTTVIKLAEHTEEEYIRVQRIYSPEIANKVREKYPSLVEIINERFLRSKWGKVVVA